MRVQSKRGKRSLLSAIAVGKIAQKTDGLAITALRVAAFHLALRTVGLRLIGMARVLRRDVVLAIVKKTDGVHNSPMARRLRLAVRSGIVLRMVGPLRCGEASRSLFVATGTTV